MKIISFAYTTAPLLAGGKSVTRRDWNVHYAESFSKGELIAAYDRSPRFKGKHVATIELTEKPYWEQLGRMPIEDYHCEGFAWLYLHPESLPKTLFGQPCSREDFSLAGWQRWRDSGKGMWVVRFKLVEVLN